METNRSDFFDNTYNDESNLLDSLYEFHPDHFSDLTADEFSTLQTYYMLAVDDDMMPADVFAYRAELLPREPLVEMQAKAIYKKVLAKAGIVE